MNFFLHTILLLSSACLVWLTHAESLPSTFSCYNNTGFTPCIIPGVEDSKCLTSMVGFARGCDTNNNNRFCTACILKFFIWPREQLRNSMTDWCNYNHGNLAEYDRTIRTCEINNK